MGRVGFTTLRTVSLQLLRRVIEVIPFGGRNRSVWLRTVVRSGESELIGDIRYPGVHGLTGQVTVTTQTSEAN